jgi:hypothetical protein
MPLEVAGKGENHRLVSSLTGVCTTDDESVLFDLGKSLNIDMSGFQFGASRTYLVKSSDSIVVDLTGLLIQVMIVSTDVPIQVNFTQDGVLRTVRVKPIVSPSNWFSSEHSPEEQPNEIQRGHAFIVGGDITTMSLVGLATMPSANVRIALVGFRS